MPEFTARPAAESDLGIWADMRSQLWPGYPHHLHDLKNYFAQPDPQRMAFIAVATTAPATPAGFIELSLRKERTTTGNALSAYIEGWFVSELIRHGGAGKAMIAAAEIWASEQGCNELTSECDIKNLASASAHQACGFEEANRNIIFRKPL